MKTLVRRQQARHFWKSDIDRARKDLAKIQVKRDKEVRVHDLSNQVIKREQSNKPLISEETFFGKQLNRYPKRQIIKTPVEVQKDEERAI